MELPSLYPHQTVVTDKARAALSRHQRAIICGGPGFGKTRCSKWILGRTLERDVGERQSGYSLFAVHRRGLVDNATGSFAEDPALPHGVIMSGREVEPQCKVQVASIDTLLSWYCEGGEYRSGQTYDLVVFDECHSHLPKLLAFAQAHDASRQKLGLHEAYYLGLSATPQCDGIDFFREIVMGPSVEWLIENGYLSPFRYFRCTTGKLDLLRRTSDWTENNIAAAMDGLAGDLVRDWKKHAEGLATVGFFPRRSHAQEAKERLIAAGIAADYVDGDTPDEERRQIFADLNCGDIDYLCNVGVVERGTDIPRIGCVQLCTAINSIVRYRQMIGRGSRIHPEVPDCIVLDHGGNIARMVKQGGGFFEDEIQWSLEKDKRPEDFKGRGIIECPICQAMYRGGKCRQCGYEPTPRERRAQGLVFDGSELVEVQRKKEQKSLSTRTPEEYMVSALYAAGKSNRTWKQAIGIAKSDARKRGQEFRVPRRVTVAGQTYRMLPYGHAGANRKVSSLFPWTVGDWSECEFSVSN